MKSSVLVIEVPGRPSIERWEERIAREVRESAVEEREERTESNVEERESGRDEVEGRPGVIDILG